MHGSRYSYRDGFGFQAKCVTPRDGFWLDSVVRPSEYLFMATSPFMEAPLTPWQIEWAYKQGVFPMASENGEILWYKPEPRAVIPLDSFKVSKSLRKSSSKFEVSYNSNFEGVMRSCIRPNANWINENLIRAYVELFHLGKGRSVESWQEGKLVGGVYGVALGGAFMAESMFHTVTDAGKVALWMLTIKLRESGYQLLDVQYQTEHLESLGAVEISHDEYLERLTLALNHKVTW